MSTQPGITFTYQIKMDEPVEGRHYGKLWRTLREWHIFSFRIVLERFVPQGPESH